VTNILLLTQVLPYPLDAGPKVRAYYMLRHLSQRHDVTLASFVRADDRPEYVAHLAQYCRAVYTVPMVRSPARNLRAGLKGLATGLPMIVARDDVPEMSALLRRLAQEIHFDLIHADQLSMAWYALLAAQPPAPPAPLPSPRLLLDAHNAIYRLTERMAAESHGLRRLIIQREARAFRRYEAAIVRRFDAVLTVTDEDRALLLDLFAEPERSQQAAKLTPIPICIDPTTTPPINHSPFPNSPINHSPVPPFPIPHSPFPNSPVPPFPIPHSPFPNSPTILHLGTMFWPPNVAGVLWFARDVLPLIWQQQPEARFVVVGKNPPAEVQALAADPRIQVTGYVADPLPYLRAADAFVVPLHSGGGMRVKILDAWLQGLPIVATPIGAEGIQLVAGENILLAADAPAFAAATLRLLTDPELNQRLRLAGRHWVEQRYAWQVVYPQVDALLG
jgi:glycosyltransferase involved in cell wall biosynthesis